jgi:hypothetical protein
MTERDLTTPKTPDQAAAALHRFAQAQKALRLYRKAKGRRATTPEELAAWVQQQRSRGRLNPIEPERQDYQAAQREHPNLVLLSNRGQPVPAKLRVPPSPVRFLQRAIFKARLALVSVSLVDRRTRVLNSTERDS